MATPLLYNIGGQRLLELQARHTRALTDGCLFLVCLAQLYREVDLEPYCLTCARLGQIATVLVLLENRHAEFMCRHTAGRIRRDRPLELEPLLKELGWNLRCAACGQPVSGDNDKRATQFTVECSCTIRTMPNPLAPTISPTPTVSLAH